MPTRERICFLDGNFIAESAAHISLRDIGLMRGFGVYDGIAAIGTHIFRFADHVARFRASAEGLGMQVGYTDVEIGGAIAHLLELHQFERSNIRLYLTGGVAINSIEFDPTHTTFFILIEPCVALSPDVYTIGASLVTQEFQRQFPEWKTTNYIMAVKGQTRRKAAGALEILFYSNDLMRETAMGNIFMMKHGVLITPGEQILKGITRKVVLELADTLGLPTDIRDVSLSECLAADEVFLTSSYKDIVPIVRIDEGTVSSGTVGLVTMALMTAFREYLLAQSNNS